MNQDEESNGDGSHRVNSRTNRFIALFVALLSLVAFVLTHMPLSLSQQKWLERKDKTLHFVLFSIVAFGISLVWYFFRLKPQVDEGHSVFSAIRKAATIGFVVTTVFATTSELTQFFIPSRTADIGDGLANISGAIFGSVLFTVLFVLRHRANLIAKE